MVKRSIPLCRSEIAHYRKLDAAGRVDFVDLSSPAADTGPDLSREAALGRFHVRGRDGELESGAAAFVRLWKELPGWRWLAVIARVPGVPEVPVRLGPSLRRVALHRWRDPAGPEVILLDLNLPDMDGMEILRKVHSDGMPSAVTIITPQRN